MGVLSASEKLKILVMGKATLKEINELEKMVETEDANNNESIVKILETGANNDPDTDKKEEPKEKPKEDPKEEPKEDEKDKRIAELESQLKEAQAENVHGNNETHDSVSFDERLNEMFKDIRI